MSDDSPITKPTNPEIPHLAEQYYKARKSLALFSGLLFAWEFIGLEITAQPVANLDIRIKSPEAAPYVLLILVLYFTLRLVIEWKQSVEERRAMWVSRFDFWTSLSIPGIALATFSIQRILNIQVADKILATDPFIMLPVVGGLSVATSIFLLRIQVLPNWDSTPWILKLSLPIFALIGVGIIFLAAMQLPAIYVITGAIFGLLLPEGFVKFWAVRARRKTARR